jgi:NAD+ kinase
MSKSDTIRASSSAYTSTGTGAAAGGSNGGRTPTSALQPVSRSVSSGSRQRQPPPPSPLSRIESGRPTDIPNGSAPQSPPRSHIPEASPCFIHSHLDKRGSGSLQEWLKNRTNDSPDQEPPHANSNKPHHRSNGPKSASHVSSPARPNHTNTSLLPSVSDTNVSRVTSPIGNGARPPLSTSGSGYDSDRSSQVGGSTILDGDFIDDEEDGGSLTRQLAETAQGVREMSKELGEYGPNTTALKQPTDSTANRPNTG